MILVLESATAACSAALIERGEILDHRHEMVGRGHAERLVPMVRELLDGRRPDSILVDCGPGSFTGIRVGLAAAHGLAIGWGVPVAGFSSLALLAASARRVAGEEVAAALQGGHGELFVQSYGGEPLAPLDEVRSLPPAEAAQAVRAERVAGSGAEALVRERGWGSPSGAAPRAADVILLSDDLRRLPPRPIYGRPPDAKPRLETRAE